MTATRAGSADDGSNPDDTSARFPSLDGIQSMTERRLRVLALLTEAMLWKKRVAEELDETPQTIGRDVHALQMDGLLSPEFVSPSTANRHHLQGSGQGTLPATDPSPNTREYMDYDPDHLIRIYLYVRDDFMRDSLVLLAARVVREAFGSEPTVSFGLVPNTSD